ncbi:VOC family protein [Nitratidesulfovibrio sp. 1201_IL3209]|uniref:VOC family protein n=1 Tax=Nitratidesulfovibrio sp. 1201_IL3209 TaxID=3084053 RepID=UPI002FDB89BC
MPRYTGFNHLAMVTGDMETTVRFWRDLLGMRIVAGLGHPGYRQYFFEVSPVDMIAFFEWDGVTPVEEKDHGAPVRGAVVFDHVSVGVASDDDLWELKDRLEAAGFWCSELVDHGFIHSLYSFDPNGLAIEFSAPVPGVDVRAAPRMTDTHPVPAAQEGPDPVPGHWPPVTAPTPPTDRRVYPGEGDDFLRGKRNAWDTPKRGPA